LQSSATSSTEKSSTATLPVSSPRSVVLRGRIADPQFRSSAWASDVASRNAPTVSTVQSTRRMG
jgi:hypothetical protein